MKRVKTFFVIMLSLVMLVANMTSVLAEDEAEKYTVTIKDKDGKVMHELQYSYGENARNKDAVTETVIDKTEIVDGVARWYKQYAKITPEGNYTFEDLDFVKQDMTFVFTLEEKELKTKFFVLNRKLEIPSEGINISQPSENYSKGLEGAISEFKSIYNDEKAIKDIIVSAPEEEFRQMLGLTDDEYIKWYVVKKEKDGYHVDGVIVNKSTTEEPATEEPAIEEPTTEEPTTEEPTTEELTTEEPATEETTTAPAEEDVEIDVPFAPGQAETTAEPESETTTEPESETLEEEDVNLEVPFAAAETGDSTKYVFYLALLVGAAVGGTAAATRKKKEEN